MQNYLSVGLGTFSTDLLPNLDNGNKVMMVFDSAICVEIMSLGGYCRRDVWHSMCVLTEFHEALMHEETSHRSRTSADTADDSRHHGPQRTGKKWVR